jgi:hypothetical protein
MVPPSTVEHTAGHAPERIGQRKRDVLGPQQVERLLGEGGERRVAAKHADHKSGTDPRGRLVPVDERRNHKPDQEAAGDVDGERAPGEHGEAPVLDQAVEPVAARSPKCASSGNGKDNGHGWLLSSVGAISRRGG